MVIQSKHFKHITGLIQCNCIKSSTQSKSCEEYFNICDIHKISVGLHVINEFSPLNLLLKNKYM